MKYNLAVLSGLFLAVHFATWISSLEYTSVASSVVFVSTSPLWVALLAPVDDQGTDLPGGPDWDGRCPGWWFDCGVE